MGTAMFQTLYTDHKHNKGSAQMKPWLVKLNASQFHKVRDADSSGIEAMSFSVDKDAQPGDLVFLAGDDYRSKDSWRIAAVLTMVSLPKFDPMNGFEAEMKVLCKPQMSIPFDVNIGGGGQIQTGVIELDLDAIDLMSDAVRTYMEVDGGSNIILEEINKMRMSS
jgi:hypothetical protein